MTDVVTSESPDVSISSSVDVATAASGDRSPAGHASPVIMRVTILLILTVFNLCGNGFTLITIRMTPRLWTKTNFILASMLAADVLTGVFVFWYTPFLLVVYVFNNSCRYNLLTAALTFVCRIPGFVSICHLILISVERYIAIIYPLHYETKFTDRTLKWAISIVWATGIFIGASYMLWLINADLRKCDIITGVYYVVDILVYIPVCISLFTFYGKILAISWRQRQRIEPPPMDDNATRGTSVPSITTQPPTQNSKATRSDNTLDPTDKAQNDTGPPRKPVATSDTNATAIAQQQRQKMKSRRREYKAVYLTAAIVGAFVVLWFPLIIGRVLASAGYNPVVVNYIALVSGPIGSFNFCFSWAIYAAVSKSYRRAYRQMQIRIGCCCCKNVTLPADNSLIA